MAVPQHPLAKSYEVVRTNSAIGGATLTLAKPAFACKIAHTGAVDAIDIKFNGGAAYRLYPGKELVLQGSEGFEITSFTYTAVANTPEIDAVFYELG